MFNNPKDIPAAVSLTFILWALLRLMKRWGHPAPPWAASVLLGCCMGVATAIRVTAITAIPVLAALLAGWWIINGRSTWRGGRVGKKVVRQAGMAGTIAVSWLLVTMALWPFVMLNPFANLVESVQVMSHYPWDGLVFFNGEEYPAPQLPASYIPTWLVIGSPPMLLLLSMMGVVIAGVEAARTRRINPAVGTVELAFGVPLAALMLLHPVLYDSLRQFLYIIPPLIVLAAYGLVRAVVLLAYQQRAGLRWMAVALLAVTIGAYALVVADMVALSPYEYNYFSPLVGGLQGASGTFETDYYGSFGTAAVTWLSQHYRQHTRAPSPTVGSSPLLWTTITPFLPASFRPDPTNPDFFIAFTREQSDLSYPTYHVIHVVAAEGVPLCVVKVNPALVTGSGSPPGAIYGEMVAPGSDSFNRVLASYCRLRMVHL